MTQMAGQDSKAKVLAAFEQILAAQRRMQSRVATKEEEAEKERNLQVLEAVAQFTPDGIVRGFADLQLSFGAAMNQLSDQLSTETDKLGDLKRAIAVETQRLQDLQQTRVVADALYILNQEHQENLRLLQERIAREQAELEKEKSATQKVWGREQAEFEQTATIQDQRLVQERQRQEENYQYETGRSRTISDDDYEEARRQAERQIQETNQTKEKQWTERETVLATNQTKLEEYRRKVEAFPQELEEATKKAREESIKETHDAAKVRANLLEKEWEAAQQGYELQIQSLEAKIQKQTEESSSISTQLQTAMGQAQDLAMRAFASSSRQLTGQSETAE
ncbi:MAG: hypothetical protein QNJ46_35030 [Leptolyngbyaceae cyanobacterium MO_188.B28]|nr:hypothetical protein [Leptolyngbyaceae cyanobacterium MO_188.B28]